MARRNHTLAQLKESYLFEEIAKRKARFPQDQLLNLGIGDTTQPLSAPVISALQEAAAKLGCATTYTGYENAFGRTLLREAISQKIYHGKISPEEIFISDGSKCDLARLQQLFHPECMVAMQDPSYPAYVGATKISGKERIIFLSCTPENQFAPDLSELPQIDLFYLCSPNNPTGHVMDHEELKSYISIAQKNGAIIVFDSAYASFIGDPSLPRSIYEIEGSKGVALEMGSFSKMSGFTGVRLGWLVVPKELYFQDGTSVREDWMKISATCFNGASNLAQAGGLAALSEEGMKTSRNITEYYMENAHLLKRSLHLPTYGGKNAPYLWVDLGGKSSWEVFEQLLCDYKIVTTPGVGFGAQGEGFLRLSAFAQREHVEQALHYLQRL
jgi:LL-diaminopimelate aminotransferase